ncbi:MAG TPA: response regulator transcription factor [Terracidiphilus sp.]|nr:response regulator transcription factor [Terracidiphilus sp.]
MKSRPTNPLPIRIGIVAVEPVRVAGLASIFDQPEKPGHARLVPVIGSLQELIGASDIEYVVVDLHTSEGSLEILETVRLTRPDVRLIVIGPEDDDELVFKAIIAGARAYLGIAAGPELMRQAIDVVTSGSIWAPRKLLSRLIDRLLNVNLAVRTTPNPQLTPREEQVLKLVLLANSTREIARQLGIEPRTVKAYIARLMRKTGADNRVKLSVSAVSHSLLAEASGKRHSATRPRQKGC